MFVSVRGLDDKLNWRLQVQLYSSLEAELKVNNKWIISFSSLTLEMVAETRNSVTFVELPGSAHQQGTCEQR